MKNRIRILIMAVIIIACAMVFSACGSKTAAKVEKMEITGKPEGLSVDVSAKELDFGLTYSPKKVSPFSVLWECSNDKIAEISKGGKLTLKTAGSVTVSAVNLNDNSIRTSFTLEITDKAFSDEMDATADNCPVTSIKITKKPGGNTVSYKNSGFTLGYTYEAKNEDPFHVKWTSTNAAVATVDENGAVKVYGIGVTTIRVRVLGGRTEDSFRLKVTGDGVSTIGFNAPKVKVMVGKSLRLDNATTYLPLNCTAFRSSWNSSNAGIAAVNKDTGVVKGVTPGIVTVTQTVAGKGIKSTILVEVVAQLPENCDSFDFAVTSATKGEGNVAFYREYGKTTLSITGDPAKLPVNGDDKALLVTSDGDDWGGVVFSLTNLIPGQKYFVDFDFRALASDTMIYVNYGKDLIINKANGTPSGFRPGVGNSYHFSGEFIAGSSNTLKVFFGGAKISGSFSLDNLFVVKQANIHISKLPLNNMMGAATTYQLIPKANVGSVGACTYTSSNPAVATVDAAGLITAHSMGQTVISLNSGGETDSFILSVVPAQAKNSENFNYADVSNNKGTGNMNFYSEYSPTTAVLTDKASEIPAGGDGKAVKVAAAGGTDWSGLVMELTDLIPGKTYNLDFDIKKLSGDYSYAINYNHPKDGGGNEQVALGSVGVAMGDSLHVSKTFMAQKTTGSIKIFMASANCNGAFTVDNFAVALQPTFYITNLPPQNTVGVGTVMDLVLHSDNPLEGTTAWTSSNPGAATIDPVTGKLRAVAVGTTTITVVNGSESYSVIITVKDTLPLNSEDFENATVTGQNGSGNMEFKAEYGVVGLSLTDNPAEIPAGGSGKAAKVSATSEAYPGLVMNLTNLTPGVTYAVDFDIKKISGVENYYVNYGSTGIYPFSVAVGASEHISTTFTATATTGYIKIFVLGGSCTGEFTIDNFTVEEPKTLTITGKPTGDKMVIGDSVDLDFTSTGFFTGLPSWTSSDTDVAMIDSITGEITAYAAGTTEITLSYGGKMAKFTLTVSAPSITITNKPTGNKLAKDATHTLDTFILGSTSGVLVWESSNTSVAEIDTDGVITTKGYGTTVIKVTYGGLEDSFTLTVNIPNTEDFENVTMTGNSGAGNMTFAGNYDGKYVVSITEDPTEVPVGGSGKAVKFASIGASEYGGIQFNLTGLEAGQSYTVTFKLKSLSAVTQTYYLNYGAGAISSPSVASGATVTFTQTFTADPTKNTMKIFAAGISVSSFTLDDFSVTKN